MTQTDVLEIALFGNLHVSVAGRAVTAVHTNRLQSLVAWLILEGDTPQPRERLASVLWPESSGPQARTNLRQLLHHLKRALPDDCPPLRLDHFTVHWQQDESCSVDVLEFRQAIADAAKAKERGDAHAETAYLMEAARLYADDLLPTLYDEWLTPVRQEYRNHLAAVLQRLAALLEERGEPAAAIPWAERLVAQDAVSESNYQLLIRLHAANHDRAAALRTYHQCKTVLRREMGVLPGPATVVLFESILKAERAGSAVTGPSVAARPAPDRKMSRQIVGRVAEMERLEQAWANVMGGGPRAVVIAGEPGIGKTRLAEEILQLADGRGSAVARGRCYSGQGQVPYAPVTEWLRSEPLRAAWSKLTPGQLAALARLVPEMLETHAPADTGQLAAENWQRFQLYDALLALFAKCEHPLLLFIDDLQWCDTDSLEWLQALLCSAAAKGILVAGTVRAEETGRNHPFTAFVAALRQAGVVVEIALEPLGAAESTELARQESAEPLEQAKLAEIFESTKGNPLFVVESARAGLQSTRGQIPRIHAVISARLAKLTPTTYELAGLASVVGRPFSFELLEKASDWDERSLSSALDELWQRRIIEGRGGAEYDFTHDRIREVACTELSLVRVRYLHRRVARALAEVYQNDSEDWNALIASHYEQAGMGEQAIEHLRLAAVSAHQRFAEPEAAALLRRALELCRQFPESEKRHAQELELLMLLGRSLAAAAGYSAAEVRETYERALELSRRLNNAHLLTILSGSWVYYVVRGELETSLQYGVEFLKAAGESPSPGMKMTGNHILGSSLYHLGRLDESLRHLEISIGAHGGPSEPMLALFAGSDIGVFCRSYLGHLHWHLAAEGEEDLAEFHAAEAIASAERLRHPFSQAIALNYAALLRIFQGDSRRALEMGLRAEQLCDKYGFSYYHAFAKVMVGWAQVAESAAAEGLRLLREGLESMRGLGAEIRLPYYYALLAESYGRVGMLREATATLSTGFAFASKNGEAWCVSELHRVQGDLSAAEGKPAQAVTSYRRGVEAARKCGSLAFERRLNVLLDETATAAS